MGIQSETFKITPKDVSAADAPAPAFSKFRKKTDLKFETPSPRGWIFF